MNILALRERRDAYEKELLETWKKTLIVIKANYPGAVKEGWAPNWVVTTFQEIIDDSLPVVFTDQSYDEEGLIAFRVVDGEPQEVKQACILWEDVHPLGRFVDLDVYGQEGALSRRDRGRGFRPCYLCGEDAVKCSRSGAHDRYVLAQYFRHRVEASLYRENRWATLATMVEYALTNELCRKRGYGCVTANGKGSHEDMDYGLFLKSAKAIALGLSEITEEDLEDFHRLRQFGLTLEKRMFEATDGINTHKGAVFIFLCLIAGFYHASSFEQIPEAIAQFAKPLAQDFSTDIATAGMAYYKTYGYKGVRGEAMAGFRRVFDWQKKHRRSPGVESLVVDILSKTDDTTTLARGGVKGLQWVQQAAKNAIYEEAREALNARCEREKWSTGGAADLLAAVVFVDLLSNHFDTLKEVWL